jgi:hypothetical protein
MYRIFTVINVAHIAEEWKIASSKQSFCIRRKFLVRNHDKRSFGILYEKTVLKKRKLCYESNPTAAEYWLICT